MDGTEGLRRGQEVVDTGKPITIPVGLGTLGRIMNVIGMYHTSMLGPPSGWFSFIMSAISL